MLSFCRLIGLLSIMCFCFLVSQHENNKFAKLSLHLHRSYSSTTRGIAGTSASQFSIRRIQGTNIDSKARHRTPRRRNIVRFVTNPRIRKTSDYDSPFLGDLDLRWATDAESLLLCQLMSQANFFISLSRNFTFGWHRTIVSCLQIFQWNFSWCYCKTNKWIARYQSLL